MAAANVSSPRLVDGLWSPFASDDRLTNAPIFRLTASSRGGYLNPSPGLDFETKLFAKVNLQEILRDELSKRNYVCKPINIGSNTDPYQPIEKKWRLTRAALALLNECATRAPSSRRTRWWKERDVEAIIEQAGAASANAIGYTCVRLPYELKQLFREWLELHYPDRAAHIISLIQQMNGSKDYDSNFAKHPDS